ncbi:BMP-binding endothelial regulator protein-like [Arctopsyche grandis]|uniref:BMP-binding endothelial regulator protein-like n=1 Tax=Arctopsyche grandis TaxID=121162 RepID=UPI00406D643E
MGMQAPGSRPHREASGLPGPESFWHFSNHQSCPRRTVVARPQCGFSKKAAKIIFQYRTGCHINGQKVSEGRDATIEEDPCLTCHCSKNKLTCAKRACPVLTCPIGLQVMSKGKCCPICSEGKRATLLFPERTMNMPCIIGKDYRKHEESFTLDKCTKCSCFNGTTICSRTSCPVLECAKEHQKTSPGECCPHCPQIEEVRSTCTAEGQTYADGESWRLDDCKSCMCHSGEPRCAMEQCPRLSCPLGQDMERPPGQCCYRCVERDSVCTVYGDPHYKTFDGKFYNFQGSCKYQLTADCVNHTFSIRVTNDGRSARYSSRTKTVSMKIGDTKINLGHKLRVKIDGKRIEMPYNGSIGNITRDKDDNVEVNTTIGIKLFWDGAGYLEVKAPISYKNRLCGLCGNFNSVVRDDLKTRNGVIFKEAGRENSWKFGESWRVGGKKACSRKQDNVHKEKPCHKATKNLSAQDQSA